MTQITSMPDPRAPSRPADPPGGHGEGEREPWNRERYGSREDEDQEDYGSGWDREGHEYGAGQDDEPAASEGDGPPRPRSREA